MLHVMSFFIGPVMAALSWQTRPGCPVLRVQFCVSSSVCFVCLSCSYCPALPVLFCLSLTSSNLLPVPFCFPVLLVPFCLSSFACPVLPVMSACPVLPVLFCLSFSSCHVYTHLHISTYKHTYIHINICINIYEINKKVYTNTQKGEEEDRETGQGERTDRLG